LTVDAGYVYFADHDGGTVKKVPIGGGHVTTLANYQSFPWSIAVDGGHVYWTDSGGGMRYGSSVGSLNAIPVRGGHATTLASAVGVRPLGPFAVGP
jgi:hypothetical protein